MPRRFEVVEDDCIGCGLCSARAPENFEIPAGSSIAQVLKQPETPDEEEACLEASDYCPMGGLLAHPGNSSPTHASESGRQPSFTPAGDSMPADLTPTRLEN